MSSNFDLRCMKRAFALAKLGAGRTSPNPMVGALLVREGRIIGEGWHKQYGGIHAEEAALLDAKARGESPSGAALYCTLEPCSFEAPDKHRRPCTGLIIENGVKNVFIAALDPNPRVNGGGVRALKNAGISVETGLLAEAEEELNRGFRTFWRLGRPFVHIKLASSIDGRIAAASGDSRWISCETSRKQTHRWRSFYDAVLVGSGCLAADDPELSVRLVKRGFKARQPLRVLLDSRLSIKEDAKILGAGEKGGKVIVFCAHNSDAAKRERLLALGAELVELERQKNGLPLAEVLKNLAGRGVRSVLVEGGAAVAGSFLREALWDRLSVFFAPLILGGHFGAVSGFAPRLVSEGIELGPLVARRSGTDILIECEPRKG